MPLKMLVARAAVDYWVQASEVRRVEKRAGIKGGVEGG